MCDGLVPSCHIFPRINFSTKHLFWHKRRKLHLFLHLQTLYKVFCNLLLSEKSGFPIKDLLVCYKKLASTPAALNVNCSQMLSLWLSGRAKVWEDKNPSPCRHYSNLALRHLSPIGDYHRCHSFLSFSLLPSKGTQHNSFSPLTVDLLFYLC